VRATLVADPKYTVRFSGPSTGEPQSSGLHRQERARKSTLTCRGTDAATREPRCPSLHSRAIDLGSDRGGVGQSGRSSRGVTSHQGAQESCVQGEGPQVTELRTEAYRGTRPHGDARGTVNNAATAVAVPSLASRVQRGVACPVLRYYVQAFVALAVSCYKISR
jgi:hypothetical protein